MKEIELGLTEIEVAWLAGLLEGEGSFHFTMTGNTPALRIQLAMTDRDIVERVAKIFSITITTLSCKDKPNNLGSVKDYYRIYICGAKARAVMRAIQPFMGKRRTEEINKQLTAWETRKTNHRACWENNRISHDNIAGFCRPKTKSPPVVADKAYLLMEAFELEFTELLAEE